MAEVLTITRVGVEEVKELIAEKYGIRPEDIKCWNGKYEFQKEVKEEKK